MQELSLTQKYPTVQEVIQLMEQLAPSQLAYDWDSIGLQVGNPQQTVRKLLLTLDSSHTQVIAEAIQHEVDLMIAHHALLFKAPKRLVETDPYQRGVRRLIQHNISVFIAHTNWDIVRGGINDILAAHLGLTEVEILDQTGTYVHSQGADALFPLHTPEPIQGIGRIGNLMDTITLDTLARSLRKSLPTRGIRMIGSGDRIIKRAAVVGGAGSEWIRTAAVKGADLLLTADLTYHDAQLAEELGLAILDPGHFALEQPSLLVLADRLNHVFQTRGWSTEITISQTNTDPFYFL